MMTLIYEHQFFIFAVATAAACGALAWLVFEMRGRLGRVLGGAHSSGDLTNDLIQRMMRTEMRLDAIEPRLAAGEEVAQRAVQKVGFLRFNPFQDTGGDNSFIIVLLDAENTGFILSSLYMREATRLYAKAVERGRVRSVVSDEEQKVLDSTIQKK